MTTTKPKTQKIKQDQVRVFTSCNNDHGSVLVADLYKGDGLTMGEGKGRRPEQRPTGGQMLVGEIWALF